MLSGDGGCYWVMTAEAGGSSSSSSGPSGPIPSAGRSPASGRRLQEVQIIQIVEGPTLIQPSEVKVSQGVVLSAEPVLTPIGKLFLLCLQFADERKTAEA